MKACLTGLCALALAGCAGTRDLTADAGSPFPRWCADIARERAEMPSPKSRKHAAIVYPSLPKECTVQAQEWKPMTTLPDPRRLPRR